MKISETETKVLTVLAESYSSYDGGCYRPFAYISGETGLDRSQVRRACRSLKRKGLADFGRGLWTEDGDPAGSGYCATRIGSERIDALTAAEHPK